MHHTENFQSTDAPKVWVSSFSKCQWKQTILISHYEKNGKMATISQVCIIWKNFKLLMPQKVWVSGFPSVDRNGISVLATMKNLKNGCHSIKMHRTEKFQITDPNPTPNPPATYQSFGRQFS